MRLKISIIIIFAASFLASCSGPMYRVWTKKGFTGKKYSKILVLNISTNPESSIQFENQVVEKLEKKGFHATNSSFVFPEGLSRDSLNDELLATNLRYGDYDAVLVSYPIDVKTREISLTGPKGYGSTVGSYQNYINDGYILMYTDKNYMEEKSYVLETSLFDISDPENKQSMVWSGQYSVTDPASFYQGAKDYASQLVKTLIRSGILE